MSRALATFIFATAVVAGSCGSNEEPQSARCQELASEFGETTPDSWEGILELQTLIPEWEALGCRHPDDNG